MSPIPGCQQRTTPPQKHGDSDGHQREKGGSEQRKKWKENVGECKRGALGLC
jgi:hypothetical protein